MVMVRMNGHVFDPQRRRFLLQDEHATKLASLQQHKGHVPRNQDGVVRAHRFRRAPNPLDIWRVRSFYASGDTRAVCLIGKSNCRRLVHQPNACCSASMTAGYSPGSSRTTRAFILIGECGSSVKVWTIRWQWTWGHRLPRTEWLIFAGRYS